VYVQGVVGETHDFYRVEAEACMRCLDVPAYLAHVQRRLDEENERIIHYLDASTRKVPPHLHLNACHSYLNAYH
jgi:hypothetical protein